MLLCYGTNCPLRLECAHHTQPNPGRDAYGALPYDFELGACKEFVTNLPSEDLIRQTAYYIWLRNGRPEHQELEHWNQAFVSLCVGSGRVKADTK
jgi:Protein of unknown function (DUF2934)